MKYRILLGCAMALLLFAAVQTAAQARVAVQDATGTIRKGPWTTMPEAMTTGIVASFSPTVSACWIEEKRKLFFFIPLPSRRIPISRTRRRPAEHKRVYGPKGASAEAPFFHPIHRTDTQDDPGSAPIF